VKEEKDKKLTGIINPKNFFEGSRGRIKEEQ